MRQHVAVPFTKTLKTISHLGDKQSTRRGSPARQNTCKVQTELSHTIHCSRT